MANIYVNECSDTTDGQKWVAMTDGRIALEKSSPRKCSRFHVYDGVDAHT